MKVQADLEARLQKDSDRLDGKSSKEESESQQTVRDHPVYVSCMLSMLITPHLSLC